MKTRLTAWQRGLLSLLLLGAADDGDAANQGDRAAVVPSSSLMFDLPAAPLDQALIAYGRLANIQVLYDAGIARGKRSTAVKGMLRPDEALELLLRGTDIRARATTPTAVTLAAVAQAGVPVLRMQAMRVDAAPELVDQRRFSTYVQHVEAGLLRALQQERRTNRMAFDVTVRIWLAEDGTIARAEIVSSTLRTEQDTAVLRVLRNAESSGSPPRDLPLPIAYRFRARQAY